MTVFTASNDQYLRNSSRIKYETIRNWTKRKQLLGKAQSDKEKETIKFSMKAYYENKTVHISDFIKQKHKKRRVKLRVQFL